MQTIYHMQRYIHVPTHGQQDSPLKPQIRQVKDQNKPMRPPHHAKDQHNLPYTHAAKFKQNPRPVQIPYKKPRLVDPSPMYSHAEAN